MTLTQRRADRVVLHNISWQQFENLLVDLGESRAARVAYDDGTFYPRLGVPEIWCYDSGELKIYQLQNEGYIEVETSLVFPTLPIQELPALIEQYRPQGRRAIRRAVREWARK